MPPFSSAQSYILRSVRRGGLVAWAIALAALAGALALRLALEPYLVESVSFVTLLGAVAVAVWMLGAHVAAGFALAGYLICHSLFAPPQEELFLSDARTVVAAAAYGLTCWLVIATGEAMRSAASCARTRGELLRVALAGIEDAVIAIDVDSSITYLNESAEILTGWSCMEALGKPLHSVFRLADADPEDDSGIERARAAHAGRPLENPRRAVLLARDAAARPIEHSVAPIKGTDGLIAGCVVTFRDISDKQRYRRAVAAANERLRAFFDQGAVFAAILQPNGTVLEPSRVSWESCGYEREQIVGKPFWEGPWWARSPILVERIRQACEQAARGEAFRAELPFFVDGGTERLAALDIVGIRDGEARLLCLAATAVDITERKRAEDDRQRLAALVESSTDFIGVYGLDFAPLAINPAGLALAGLASVEDARRLRIQELFAPEDRAYIMGEFFAAVMREGRGATEARFRNPRGGELRRMSCRVMTLQDTLGRRTGYALIAQDITERRAPGQRSRAPEAGRSEADGATSANASCGVPLPQRGAAQDQTPTPACARKPLRRVLLVDDDRDIAAALAMLLQLQGHPTFVAHDGAAALDAAEKHRPDVVFLDIGMPVLSGYEVCRRLRERPYCKDTIIVALTGRGDASDRRRTREAGFDGHLVKPVNYMAIAAVLESGAVRDADHGRC